MSNIYNFYAHCLAPPAPENVQAIYRPPISVSDLMQAWAKNPMTAWPCLYAPFTITDNIQAASEVFSEIWTAYGILLLNFGDALDSTAKELSEL